MNAKQLAKLIVAVVLVVGIGLALKAHRQSSLAPEGQSLGQLLLPALPVNDLQGLVITDKDGQLELSRKDGLWRVVQRQDYAADFGTIGNFLRDVAELKATQTVEVGVSQYGRLSLLPPDQKEKSGTEIRFVGKDGKDVATLRLGKEYQKTSEGGAEGFMGGQGGYAAGRYILVPSAKKVVLVSKPFTTITSKPTDWLDKEFVKISDVKDASLEENGKTLWQLKKEKAGDTLQLAEPLAAGEELDADKVRSVANAFSWAAFTDVLGQKVDPAVSGLNAPKTFKAADPDGFQYTVRIGSLNKDQKYHVAVEIGFVPVTERVADKDEKPEDKAKKDQEYAKKLEENGKKATALQQKLQGWVFLMDKYTLDNVLKERKDFIKEKPKAEAAPAAGQNAEPKAEVTLAPAPAAPPPPPPPAATPVAKP